MSTASCAVPVRTVGEQAYRIRELRVRFYRADMLFKPSPEAADEYLRGVVNAAGRESAVTVVPDALAALHNGASSGFSSAKGLIARHLYLVWAQLMY